MQRHRCAGIGPADVLVGRVGVLAEERYRGHQHAGCAEAALQRVALPERFLDRMQRTVACQPFHGADLGAIGTGGQHLARFHGQAVHQDRARAAVAGVAADVGAREAGLVADEVHQEEPRLHVERIVRSVDGGLDRYALHDRVEIPHPASARIPAFQAVSKLFVVTDRAPRPLSSFRRKPESRGREGQTGVIPPPHPSWIPAFAGMTIRDVPAIPNPIANPIAVLHSLESGNDILSGSVLRLPGSCCRLSTQPRLRPVPGLGQGPFYHHRGHGPAVVRRRVDVADRIRVLGS